MESKFGKAYLNNYNEILSSAHLFSGSKERVVSLLLHIEPKYLKHVFSYIFSFPFPGSGGGGHINGF